MNRLWERLHWVGAALVFVITQVVYVRTMTISCPFWDSGEFIATSYILGIPHPPGTPLYVLIGRFFSMLPFFPQIATRVNWLSALSGSLSAVFMYLFTVELWRRWRLSSPGARAVADSVTGSVTSRPPMEENWERLTGFFAGITAALFCAFSTTVWDNAIEAEVYSLAALIMALSAWLIMRWSRVEGDARGKAGLFLVMYYLICLSMGIALSAFLILPGIVLFALLEDPRFFAHGRTGAMAVAGLTILLHPGMLPTLGLPIYLTLVVLVLIGVVFMGRKWPAVSGHGLLTWCLVVAVLALSTHFYLTIRALYHNPSINEADPQSWDAFWKVLTRDQYKPPNPFLVRKAPWGVQLGKHFWDYAKDQYSLGLRPAWVGWYLPYLLGVVGLVAQARRDFRGFALLASSYLIMTLGLVFYLNFATDEVRPRDYFFAGAFQFFPVWIGLGVAALLRILRRGLEGEALATRVVAGGGIVAACLPLLTMNHFWFEHDRTRFYIARDFAYNMLTPLKPNAIIFTNGDNDTFPLWYLQEVEHIRKDVRVANLSLLNTDWYIRQLRDFQPKIDIGWSDDQIHDVALFSSYIDAMQRGYVGKAELEEYLRQTGIRPYVRSLDLPLLTKDVAVSRIVEREYGKRPLYVALTVPDAMGMENRLVQEGIVFEIQAPGKTPERVDLEQTVQNLTHVYRYTGLLRPDGTNDNSVYKDENAMRLVQNYAAAYISAAEEYRQRRDLERATAMLSSALALTPESPPVIYSMALMQMEMGREADAEQLLQTLTERGVADPKLYRVLARVQAKLGHLDTAEQSYRLAARLQPNQFDSARDLFFFLWDDKKDRAGALSVLQDWLARHPDDKQGVREALAAYSDSARILGQGR